MSKIKVLVTGATGKQGGALARELVAKGHDVRGLTRDVNAPAAKALAAEGIEPVAGDFDDAGSLRAAMKGSDQVFLMGTPYSAGGPELEIRQGFAAVDAAKAEGVGRVVYTSVGSADQATGIPHFDSKFVVERHLRTSGVPFVIVAPVYFMDNLFSPWGKPNNGVVAMAMPAGRKFQQVSVRDLGRFYALVTERQDLTGERIDVAGDELTGQEMTDIIARASGKALSYFEVPIAAIRAGSEDSALMFEYFDRVGYRACLDGLRRRFPEVGWQTYEAWAKGQDWENI